MVAVLIAHFYMIEEDDVALEVFWVLHVIVSFHFLSIVGFIVGRVGQFIGSVYPVVGLSEIFSELFILLCRLLRIRDAAVG